MVHREFGFCMPDAIPSGDGRFIRKPWSYAQGYRGVRLDDSYLVIFDGARLGGGPGEDCAERVWAIRYPLDQYQSPTFHSLWGADRPDEHECYRPSLIRTPSTWPDEQRWIAAYTSTRWSTVGGILRQHVGFAWAPDPLGPWTYDDQVVPPRDRVPHAPDKQWPPGVWAVALLVYRGEVLLVVRDASVPQPLIHEVYRIASDHTYERIGVIEFPGMAPATDVTDVMYGGGGIYVLESPRAHKEVVEWYGAFSGPWPERITMKRSGRAFQHTNPHVRTYEAGYMREPDGSVASPGETVFAAAEVGRGVVQVGDFWGQMWTSVPSPTLERTPLPVEVIE